MRKLKFIAWDKKNQTMKRLGKVELVKGELILKDHVILQFTGYYDKLGKEIYEGDVLLSNGENRSKVIWHSDTNGWKIDKNGEVSSLTQPFVIASTRLYNCNEKN